MKATALALVFVGCYWIMNGYQTMSQEGSYGILQIALGVGRPSCRLPSSCGTGTSAPRSPSSRAPSRGH